MKVTDVPKPSSTATKRMRAEHLKRKADTAIKDGNNKLAYQLYTECLEVKPDREVGAVVNTGVLSKIMLLIVSRQ